MHLKKTALVFLEKNTPKTGRVPGTGHLQLLLSGGLEVCFCCCCHNRLWDSPLLSGLYRFLNSGRPASRLFVKCHSSVGIQLSGHVHNRVSGSIIPVGLHGVNSIGPCRTFGFLSFRYFGLYRIIEFFCTNLASGQPEQ